MLRSKLSSLREYLTPIKHTSDFTTTGEISPEEFVEAGDYLVYKFPTWQWSSAPDKLKKDFLPPDKQYLITKHVSSYQRAVTYLGIKSDLDEDEEELEDGWVKSHKINSDATSRLKGDALEENPGSNANDNGDANEINDIDELIDENAEEQSSEDENDFEELVETNANSNLRKYDLYITYSTSYRVPKMYLVGFNSNGIPLLPKQMFEDISGDYRDKTATIETLPVSYNTMSVSIHPCKHSSVMKVLMAHAAASKRTENPAELAELAERTGSLNLKDKVPGRDFGEDVDIEENVPGIRVDQYLIIFLKFIASVTPGIEYDYTMDAL
ncbi:unnamed protein product [Debaryomyces tyrocola]|nr:unnamed protein product [Debaryomyces tyrocola]